VSATALSNDMDDPAGGRNAIHSDRISEPFYNYQVN